MKGLALTLRYFLNQVTINYQSKGPLSQDFEVNVFEDILTEKRCIIGFRPLSAQAITIEAEPKPVEVEEQLDMVTKCIYCGLCQEHVG